ncbi:MAG: hypothetical protein ACKVX7_05710 [Planctomycetota bacterium]
MRNLLLVFALSAGCATTPDPAPHRPTSRWSLVDGATVINGFAALTAEQARGVAQDRTGTLYLPDLRIIDAEVAAALAETQASSLHLCGLTRLDLASARALARYESGGDRVLCLDGLVDPSSEVLAALSLTESWGLSLNGIRRIDGAGLRALGARPSELGQLELGGVTSVDEQAAHDLRFLKAKFCYLSGLEKLSLLAAESLARAEIEMLNLTGLRDIDAEVAAALAAWEQSGRALRVQPSVRLLIERARAN